MSTSELITNQHRQRKAIIYIRQSTPQQVISNQESLKMQRALRERAVELGWPAVSIETVEDDLGLSGTSAEHREGFKRMVAEVTLGQVGMLLCFDISRLIRNCSDLYPVLDVCGYKDCLIADRDGVYDPASTNGRLLLGLKGQLAEVELSTIRARLLAGKLNKAKRGELLLRLPAGFVRAEDDSVHKDPDLEIQKRIALVFETFFRLRAVAKVVRFFNEKSLFVPRADVFEGLCWRKPSTSALLGILKNPAYAGAYVYGRYQQTSKHGVQGQPKRKVLPLEQWSIVLQDRYPAYISWEDFVKIQRMLRDNYAEYDKNKTRGIPRNGKALLHGLLYCGECGHKMLVTYKHISHYMCNHLRRHYGEKLCQDLPTDPIDAFVVAAFFEAFSAVELNAYQRAMSKHRQEDNKVKTAWGQQLERLRYQTQLAERQYNRTDPDNRLVASELERRWEQALRDLKKAEEEYQKNTTVVPMPCVSAEMKEAFSDIGKKLPALWNSAELSAQQKKAFLRCLIDKVVVHRSATDRAHVRIVWRGNDTTSSEVVLPVSIFTKLPAAHEIEKKVEDMVAQKLNDTEIAACLSAQGYHSPASNKFLPSTVTAIRTRLAILKRPERYPTRIPKGYLSLLQLSKKANIGRNWIYRQIDIGAIEIERNGKTRTYFFPDTPETITRLQQLKERKINKICF